MDTVIPPKVLANIPALYSGDEIPLEDKVALARVFSPIMSWSWYCFEAGTESRACLYFGYVFGDFPEMGYFAEEEWQDANGRYPGSIEFDFTFEPRPFSAVQAFHRRVGDLWPRTWAEGLDLREIVASHFGRDGSPDFEQR
jgi:hypothetical protein